MDKISLFWYNKSTGSLAQLARAPRLHRGGQEFEPLATHHFLLYKTQKGEASDLASLDASLLTTHHFLLQKTGVIRRNNNTIGAIQSEQYNRSLMMYFRYVYDIIKVF